MSELPLRRRFERLVVREQARLEAGAGSRWIPVLVAVSLSSTLGILSLSRINGLRSGGDLAAYSQGLWLLSEGFEPRVSLFGSDVHLLEQQWSFVLFPLSLVARLVDPARLLVFTQAVALGVGVFPLWRLARGVANLRVGASSALILAYALHPAVHTLGTSDFHPAALAVPSIIGVAYFGSTKKWVWYWACVILVLACRADLGLAIGLWGFVLLSDGQRSSGLWTLGVGLVWSLGLLLVVQPLLGDGGVAGGGFDFEGDVAGGLSSDLFARDNVGLVVSLLGPVIFLPLLSIRYLFPAVPLAAFYLVAETTSTENLAARTALLFAFVMIATAHALNRLGKVGVDRVFLDVRLLTALVAASVLLFIDLSPTSPYERPWRWEERGEAENALVEAVDELGPDTVVRASPSVLTAIAYRPWLYELDSEQPLNAIQAGFRTRAVLIDERQLGLGSDGSEDVESVDLQGSFRQNMESNGFRLEIDDVENGVYLYLRQ